jgi:predicted TIM-barrel fold metal-dependent hydrolase
LPFTTMPVWDPRSPYELTLFSRDPKQLACADPIVSPMTDNEVMTETIAAAERRNIYGVLAGAPARVDAWLQAAPRRFIPAADAELGRNNSLSLDELRALHAKGRLAVMAEIGLHHAGILPDDPRMEPHWALAEELDIPAGIHIGPGPPGALYLRRGNSNYRARQHSALTLEEVLVKHPKLRIYIMHAGYPMLEDLLAVLYAHPQVYVDIGVIVWGQPRPAFYRYLQGIFEAGFGNRVMFGSDQMVWPGLIERSIQVIEAAPFLTEQQKRDVLYNNAARFLRFSDAEIARHHGR